MKSLTCINSRLLVGSAFIGYVLVIFHLSFAMDHRTNFVARKLTFVCNNKLLKVCSLNRNVCMGFEARFLI